MSKVFKSIFVVALCVAMVLTIGLVGCKTAAAETTAAATTAAAETTAAATTAAETTAAETTAAMAPKKIAFFVSELTITFLQGQFASAKEYAKEKYNSEVFVFDGKSDANVMTQNIDQLLAQGMDMATLQIWDPVAAKPGVLDAIDKGIIFNTFFSPLGDVGIPVVRNDEAKTAFAMGVEMATQWKKAHPDKPIVMVQLGWPDYPEVITGRTEPFVKGVLSVDSTATDLGCLDATKGQDAAKQIMLDTVTQHPEVNLIYGEASHITVGLMAGLEQAGRGKMKAGVPLTEIVCSTDYDQVEFKKIYDDSSSLKLSMGLPTIQTSQARIDNLFDILSGKAKQIEQPPSLAWAETYNISYWTMPRADAASWLKREFDVTVE